MCERQVSDLQHIYNKLLFDSINEALSKILGGAAEQQPVWLAYNRPPPPLTRPPTGAALVQRVQQVVAKWSEKQCGDDQKVPTHTLTASARKRSLHRLRTRTRANFICHLKACRVSPTAAGRRKTGESSPWFSEVLSSHLC